MEEIKSTTCHPDYESDVIKKFQDFGWTFVSTQDVKSKDSHLEFNYNIFLDRTISTVTETEHYTKLTFKRDTSMPNYDEISRLEKEYDETDYIQPVGKKLITWKIGLLGVLLFLILVGYYNGTSFKIPFLITISFFCIIGILKKLKINKRNALISQENERINAKLISLRSKASALVNQ